MIILNTEFSNEEKDVLLKYAGNTYEVLQSIEGKSFIIFI